MPDAPQIHPTVGTRIEILARCLQAIASGEASIASCVQQYPDFEALGELLSAASVVEQLPVAEMPALSKNRLKQQVIAHWSRSPSDSSE